MSALDAAVRRLREVAVDAGVTAWVHARRLDGSAEVVELGADEQVSAASLYKLPVAIAWADLVDAGGLDARTLLAMPAADRASGPTGVGMLLDDVALTSRDAVRLMLAVSDNVSADAVVGHVGRDRLNERLRTMGVRATVLRRSSAEVDRDLMLDTGAATVGEAGDLLADPDHERSTRQYDPAYSSATTAADMTHLLAGLWEARTTAASWVCEAMRLQAWRHRIGSGFPHDDVVVSGKTGTLGRMRHEAAVVEFPFEHPVAVAVLTRAVRNERHLPRVDAAIGELARTAVTALRRPLG